jgi:hypothetical protein
MSREWLSPGRSGPGTRTIKSLPRGGATAAASSCYPIPTRTRTTSCCFLPDGRAATKGLSMRTGAPTSEEPGSSCLSTALERRTFSRPPLVCCL